MSTSADATQNLPNPVRPQPTPVIIKAGAEEVGTNGKIIEISSPMPFTDNGSETWEVSESTLTGRLDEVTVWDNGIGFDILVTPSASEPTSVIIHCGEKIQIVIGEKGPLDTQDVHLSIESNQVPFQVIEELVGIGWTDSQAKNFSDFPTRVVVMQGQSVVKNGDYEVKHPSTVNISPNFRRF
jgi:hypothetical protein